jgi:hypothetical protein
MSTKVLKNMESERMRELEQLSHFLDSKFSFLGFRFGIDSIVGLVPGIGDVVSGIVAFYIVLQGYMLGVSKWTMIKMCLLVLFDLLLGSLPIIGDLLDAWLQANNRNVRAIKKDVLRSSSQ